MSEYNTTTIEPRLRGALPVPTPEEAEEYEIVEAPREGFQVTDLMSANWVAAKILSARAYAARMKAFAKHEVARADKVETSLMAHYGPQMAKLIVDTNAGAKRKSLDVLCAKIGLRAQPVKLIVPEAKFDELPDVSEKAALMWAMANLPEAVVAKTQIKTRHANAEFMRSLSEFLEAHDEGCEWEFSLDMKEVNAYFQSTGEVPECFEVTGGQDALYITELKPKN